VFFFYRQLSRLSTNFIRKKKVTETKRQKHLKFQKKENLYGLKTKIGMFAISKIYLNLYFSLIPYVIRKEPDIKLLYERIVLTSFSKFKNTWK